MPMHVVVTGSTGLIGSALVSSLTAGEHHVTRLVRTPPRHGEAEVQWDPETGSVAVPGLEGVDAVIHLAGENIAKGRWTAAKKARIRNSRVHGTRVLCEALTQLAEPPKVLVSASAIGYYGERGAEVLSETSRPGQDFLAWVCRDWEAATEPAAQCGIRVVRLRIGVVLSPAGGALGQMLGLFTLGIGGVIGTGKQYFSWVAIDDVVSAIHHALITETLHGPVNAVAPYPITNREFTKTLGRVLRRPTLLTMPTFAARLFLGEMADALLLASTRVEPSQLHESGFHFRYPELEGALRQMLSKG
ncbi:Epimerase family protein [Candidatus Entotheonellaceae bacterium PAL068K]